MRAMRVTMIFIGFYLYVLMRREAGVDSQRSKRTTSTTTTTIHPQLQTFRPSLPTALFVGDEYKMDHLFKQMKDRMTSMAEELLRESFFKIHQLSGIRDDHMEIVAFELGVIIGNIYEKYQTIVTFYRQVNDRFRYRTRVMEEGSYEFWPLKFLVYYEHMHHVEMDIMQLLDIMESVPKEMLEMKFRVDGDDEDEEEKKNVEKARQVENYKQETREKYLRRRLGLPANGSSRVTHGY